MHLAAHRESLAAFGRRFIPPDSGARRSSTGSTPPPRALSAGRIVGLGATRDFHDGLLGEIWLASRFARVGAVPVYRALGPRFLHAQDHAFVWRVVWRSVCRCPDARVAISESKH